MSDLEDKDINRYIELKYFLLENKYIYYRQPVDYNGKSIKGISDIEYDKAEAEYKTLYNQLGLLVKYDANISEMVDFDDSLRESKSAINRVQIRQMPDDVFEKYRKQVLKDFGCDLACYREFKK